MWRCPPQKKLKSKAAAMPAPSAVGANAAPAKSKTDPPASGFGGKSIVIALFSIWISLLALGFGGSYIYGRNNYIVRDLVLTDATYGDVPPTIDTAGGECEAKGVVCPTKVELEKTLRIAPTKRSRYSTLGDVPPTDDTVGGQFEARIEEAEEASSEDEEESSSDDEEEYSSEDEEKSPSDYEVEVDSESRSYDEAEASLDKSPLQVGQIQPMQVVATGQIIADHVYRIGLPSSVRLALLKMIKETGILNEFYHTNAHPLAQGETKYKTFDGQDWFVQRPPSYWRSNSSNAHWLSPDEEAAHQRGLRALGDGGFDQVLDAIGQHFNMDGLFIYHLFFIGVSQCQDGYFHTDHSDTDAKAYNLIIPLELVADAGPELNVVDTDNEVIYEYKYEYDTGVMIGDYARHRTASVNYDSGAMRIFASIELADINEDNVDSLINEVDLYEQKYPPADREYLLARRGQHWGNGKQLPKTSWGEDHSEL